MRLEELMNPRVVTVPDHQGADSAWSRMRSEGVRHFVVTRNREVVGVISDRDLGGPRGARVRHGRTVGDLMTESVVTATPSTTVRQAANLLRGRSIGCLPVLDGRSRVVGIITVADLLELLGRGVERPRRHQSRPTLRQHKGPRQRAESRLKGRPR